MVSLWCLVWQYKTNCGNKTLVTPLVCHSSVQWFMDVEPSCRVKNISSGVTTASLSFYRHCLQPYQWAPSPPMELSQVSLEILHSCYRFYPQYTGHSPHTFVMEFERPGKSKWMCMWHIDFTFLLFFKRDDTRKYLHSGCIHLIKH